MKKTNIIKNLYCFTYFLMFFFAITLISENILMQKVFAENNIITNLTSVLYLDDIEAEKNGATYQANFINTSTPYLKHTVKTTITTSPTSFEDLEEIDKQTIISDMQWYVNGLAISFTNSTYTCNDFDLILQGQNLDITPKKSGPILIECNLNGIRTQINLMCNYTDPTQVNITTTDNLIQTYENYEEITLTADFNLKDYLNPNVSYTYNWYINNQRLSETTNTLLLTKELIRIGIMEISVEVNENKLLFDTIQIEITTEEQIPISITYSGELIQTIGENTTPIVFLATIPVTDNYQVIWYLQSPTSDIFKKLNTQENSYTFNPLSNSNNVGKYKILAKIIYRNITQISDIISFEIKAQEVTTEKQFKITTTEYNNTTTNVSAFICNVDTKDYFDDKNVVWYVNGKAYALGSSIEFEPIYAGEYILEVRIKNDNGTTSNPISTYNINAKTLKNVNIWIYISVGLVVFIGFCVTAIVISNKVREKIW